MDTHSREIQSTDRSNRVVDFLLANGMYEIEDDAFKEPVRVLARRALAEYREEVQKSQEVNRNKAPATIANSSIDILEYYIEGDSDLDLYDRFTKLKWMIPSRGIDVWAEEQLKRYVRLRKKNEQASKEKGQSNTEWEAKFERNLDNVIRTTLGSQDATQGYAGQLLLLFGKAKADRGLDKQTIWLALQQGSVRLRRDIANIPHKDDLPSPVKQGSLAVNEVIGHSMRELQPVARVVATRAFQNDSYPEEERVKLESFVAHLIEYLYGDEEYEVEPIGEVSE